MKAIVLKGSGEPRDVLTLAEISDPAAPDDAEVMVRLLRRVVHAADKAAIRGFLPADIFAPDGVLGIDGVGIVGAVGADVNRATGIVVGARVVVLSTRKTWAEHVVAPATHVVPVPDDIDDDIACQLASNGATAVMLLQAAGEAAGGDEAPLLVTAAGSNVARAMIALAALRGRRVIGLVRRDADAAALAGRFDGLTVISTDRHDWQSAVRAAADRPLKVAIDPIGGSMVPKLLESVADGGTVIVYGSLDSHTSSVSSGMLTSRGLTIRGLSVLGWPDRTLPEHKKAGFESLFAVARRAPEHFGGVRVFALADAVEAVRNAEASPRRGATILVSEE